jgi:hypothetical protein
MRSQVRNNICVILRLNVIKIDGFIISILSSIYYQFPTKEWFYFKVEPKLN